MSRRNDEGVSDCGAYPPKTNQNQHLHFARDDDGSKALATMQAPAELCNCTLHDLPEDGCIACRWNHSRAVPCLRAVGDLLRQIGCRQ